MRSRTSLSFFDGFRPHYSQLSPSIVHLFAEQVSYTPIKQSQKAETQKPPEPLCRNTTPLQKAAGTGNVRQAGILLSTEKREFIMIMYIWNRCIYTRPETERLPFRADKTARDVFEHSVTILEKGL